VGTGEQLMISNSYNRHNARYRCSPAPARKNLLLAGESKQQNSDYILLCGHTDTVFPPEMNFNQMHLQNDKITGPGVIDMKGGLVIGMMALKFLQEMNLLHLPLVFFFNSDEEIGSPSSKEIFSHLASQAKCALVLECGGLENEVVTGRKGKIGMTITTSGKSGHAAFILKDKKSAILEMAHKIIALENLNNFFEDASFNVGRIEGGVGPNSVPARCSIMLDIRYA
jgi:glutamate carboxypeptidase